MCKQLEYHIRNIFGPTHLREGGYCFTLAEFHHKIRRFRYEETLMKDHITAILAIALLVFVAVACNFNTANISELKFGKNEKADPATTSFNKGEDIFAVATVSNAGGKFKMTWKVTYDNVPGKGKGEEIGTNSREFEGSSVLWQTFSSPLPGEYKVEATLSDDSGKQIDSKSGMVTVK